MYIFLIFLNFCVPILKCRRLHVRVDIVSEIFWNVYGLPLFNSHFLFFLFTNPQFANFQCMQRVFCWQMLELILCTVLCDLTTETFRLWYINHYSQCMKLNFILGLKIFDYFVTFYRQQIQLVIFTIQRHFPFLFHNHLCISNNILELIKL